MNRRELNNLIKEELESAIKGHPSYLEEVEDMEAGEIEEDSGCGWGRDEIHHV